MRSNYRSIGYIIATDYYMNEYGGITKLDDGAFRIAYFGPPLADSEMPFEFFREGMGNPTTYVSGSYGREGISVSKYSLASHYRVTKPNLNYRYTITFDVDSGDFVLHKGNLLPELHKKRDESIRKQRTQNQIDLFESFSDDEKKEFIADVMLKGGAKWLVRFTNK